jgi:formylglycine-generating enzyme required for sulfatase activity
MKIRPTQRLLYLICGLLAAPPLHAAQLKNLHSGQQANLVYATYDLVGKPGELEAEVKAVIEMAGEKYAADRLALKGDLGKGVKTGVGRRITWDLLKDMPAGYDGEVTWDLEAVSPQPAAASPASVGHAAAPGPEIVDPVTGMAFLPIPGGCLKMGDSFGDGDEDERPLHEVCLEPFYLGKFEVTQSQWQAVMGSNPSYFKQCGKNCPVEGVSWADVNAFITKLCFKGSQQFRLPTEAEWEYAASGGGRREKYSGIGANAAPFAWYQGNAAVKTHPVGQKRANALGLFDMSGNVAEWVADYKDEYPALAQKSPLGPDTGNNRVVRGGSWLSIAKELRASSRSELNPSVKTNALGFRLVLIPNTSGN